MWRGLTESSALLSRPEVRVATVTRAVLFTDLVGSTALMSRLGEVRADEVRRQYFAVLRSAAEANGGHEVKNLGDGLMVVFEGTGAAVTCAIAMQQAVARHSSDEVPLHTRVGVSVGEVDEDDGDYFGVPVVEAARLCSALDGDGILITDMVRLLARSRGGFEIETVGELELKGLDDPVLAHRVLWAPAPMEEPETWTQRIVVALGSGTVIGRSAETDMLDTAMKAARAGDRQAVFLGGEPGIGKTTLATSFALREQATGAVVLFGRCDEDLHVPYQPWSEALAHLVAAASDEVLAEHVGACGPALARVVPELGRRLAASEARAGDEIDDRHMLARAVGDLVRRAVPDHPMVLIVDDLHWSDTASLQLLRQVLIGHTVDRLLVIGTYRDSEMGADHPLADLFARMHRERGVERLTLRGLADDELLALLETVAGHEMDAAGVALRDALLAETDGNPFFVNEMLRHLRDTGSIRQDDTGRWVADDDITGSGLPVSIREVVGRRVRWLGDDAHRTLVTASVIGRTFGLDVLESAASVDIDELIDLCDRAVEAAILRPVSSGEYTFAHALIERALYDELSPTRRARAHLAVAQAIEAQMGDDPGDLAAELAYHWAKASRPVDIRRAIRYARLAGDQALARFAPSDAARWYQEALGLDPAIATTADGLEIRIALCEARRRSGDLRARPEAIATARDAMAIDLPDLLVGAALAITTNLLSAIGAVDTDAIEVLEAAVMALPAGDSAPRAQLMARLAHELSFHPDARRRLELVDEALAVARRLGDDRVFADVVQITSNARAVPGRAASIGSDEATVLATASSTLDLSLHALMLAEASFTVIDLADRDTFDDYQRRLATLVKQIDEAQEASHFVTFFQWMSASLDGDPDRMDECANRYLAATAGTAWEPAAIVTWGAWTIEAAHQRGQLGPLLDVIEDSVRTQPGLPVYRAVFAWALAHEGQVERAAELVTAEWSATGFDLLYNAQWLFAQSVWALNAHIVGDAESAALLLARLEPHTDVLASTRATVSCAVAFYAGLARSTVGDLDTAVAHLEHAGNLHRRVRSPFLTAQSDQALGTVLAKRGRPGDSVRARSLAEDALAVATAHNYGYVERDARLLLDSVS